MPTRFTIPAHRCAEWTLASSISRVDPWHEIQVHAVMTADDGTSLRVPAFWDGGETWKVRLTATHPGTWNVRTECSDSKDPGLCDQRAILEVEAPAGKTRLHRHGAVRIASSGKHFEHVDGTPFSWLGDTWWMLTSERVSWPEGFQRLTAHRAAQGFTVVQIVVGFPPDLGPFDAGTGNAGGVPWEPNYQRINPGYFGEADHRLAHLIESGIVPCIFGSWGYHLSFMGQQRMISHWRYLVARYAAWPVLWCLAGEGGMPYYLSEDGPGESERQKCAWPQIAREVRAADPWRRPLTLHPRRSSWDDTNDPATLDFHMLQPGHLSNALQIGTETLAIGRDRFANQIIVNAEPPYEGHGGTNGPEIQRYAFWSTMLSGGGGFTYGAAGLFQANDRERPAGNRPDGGAFDAVFWDESMLFAGAEHIAAGHRLLTSFPFHRFEPHPEWVEAPLAWGAETYHPPFRTFAAGVPAECRIIYVPLRWYHWKGPLVKHLEPGVRYRTTYIEPATMRRHDAGIAEGGDTGCWCGPTLPFMQDWLVVMQRS